jgi:hypothetical protein
MFEFMQAHNIKYTSSRKDQIFHPNGPLENETFLKRGFRLHDTRKLEWTAPLNPDSMYDMLNWIKGDDPEEAVKMTLESFCRELWHHGRETYTEEREKLLSVLAENDICYTMPSWFDMDTIIHAEASC